MYSTLPKLADSLAGRMAVFTLYPVSQLELAGTATPFTDRLFQPNFETTEVSQTTTLTERILTGGYPEVLERTPERREVWFENYVRTFVQRDVRELSNITGLIDFARLLRLLALRSGHVLNQADVARNAALNSVTFKRYYTLLELSYLLHSLPAWFFSAPKVHMLDTGLLAHLTQVSVATLEADRDRFGALLETFVFAELLKQSSWSKQRVGLYHYRVHSGAEIDLVLEAQNGQLIGLEIKATSTPRQDDFRGLTTFMNDIGKRFERGIVLHMGTRTLPFGDKLWAMPVSSLWS
jgi:uncharacterized protein